MFQVYKAVSIGLEDLVSGLEQAGGGAVRLNPSNKDTLIRGFERIPLSTYSTTDTKPKARILLYPHTKLLLVGVRAALALGLDEAPLGLGGPGALGGRDLDGQGGLVLLDGDLVHAALVLLLPAPVLQALGSHQGLDVATCLLGDGVGGHVPPAQRVRGPGAAHGHLVLPVVQEAALLRRGLFTKAGQPLVTSTHPSTLSHNNPASAVHNAQSAQYPTNTAPLWDSLQAGELERVRAEVMRIMNDEGEEKIRLTGLVTFRATDLGKIPMFKQSAVNSAVRTFSLLIPAAETFAGGMCHQEK